MVNLGDRAKDVIGGFSGIVTAETQWLYGCRRVAIQPEKPDKDGKHREAEWFDEDQVKVVKRAAVRPPQRPTYSSTGGPARGEEVR